MAPKDTAEGKRLGEARSKLWRHWGPYISERAWGTVREDYSADGEAWQYLTHEQARSKAYRWGEDGIAGICDRYQLLVFSLALWNEKDPFLKERLFGLTPNEGNHGEDVKEYYFYLDNTPTHSYMRMLYKYPQAEFPYHQLVEVNQSRQGKGMEYELLDTGVFSENRYFDVFFEYAKASPEDIVIRIETINRGPDPAPLHLIPQLWFRNTWTWRNEHEPVPLIESGLADDRFQTLRADDGHMHIKPGLQFDYRLGERLLYAPTAASAFFTNNESNNEVLYGASNNTPYVKDGFHRRIVHNDEGAVTTSGTKACFDYRQVINPGESYVLRLRLTNQLLPDPLADVEQVIATRKLEADEFYDAVAPAKASPDERLIQRQAFAGLLWSKQAYFYDVNTWLTGDNAAAPPPASRKTLRNSHWRHLNSTRILSMPDKWEYPWFAAWDLAFHAAAFALIDADFAKEQLWLMLFEQFQHPSGQIPAYEWEFDDLNPPVHAWGVWRVYNMDRIRSGVADRSWLEKCFHKLLMNFAWWVNKVDHEGNNVFEGGFLGLDNISVIDRSKPLANGAMLQQSDGTGWMGMFCLQMMRIALELAKTNKVYESLATKFFEHYIYVGSALTHMGGEDQGFSLWDDQDGFFYDVLLNSDGTYQRFPVRSLVGLIPLYAVERLEIDWVQPFAEFTSNFQWFIRNRRDLTNRCCHYLEQNGKPVYALTVIDEKQIARILARLFDPAEFLSDYGIRSLSRYHAAHPYRYADAEVKYEPAETDSKIKGGNSNWRGPIWFPTTFLLIESLRKLGKAYGEDFRIADPQTGELRNMRDWASIVAERLIRIFTRNDGRRAVFGDIKVFQNDPHWRDYIPFHEYFHGDNGAGIGASHQTGWTALMVCLIDEWRQ